MTHQLIEKFRTRFANLHTGAEHGGVRVANTLEGAGPTSVYLYDTIGGYEGVTATMVMQALAGVRGDVDLHINSGGGEIFEGVAIHNAFKNHPGKVTCYIDGVAASAASFIAMAADRVLIEPNATMMIHDGMALAVGNAADLREAADLLDKLSNTIAEMYAVRAGGTPASWRKKMQSETWYSAKEARSAGLVDGILDGSEDDPTDPENRVELAVFNRTDTDHPATFDVEGLRNALKEVLA